MDYVPIPTITEAKDYNLREDIGELGRITEHIEEEEEFNSVLYKILLQRSNKQRRDISRYYTHSNGRDLVDDLKRYFGHTYSDFIDALFQPTKSYLADEINRALISGDERELNIVEIMIPRTHAELKSLADIYETRHDQDLISDLQTDIPGHFRKIFIAILEGGPRDSNEVTNINKAQMQAARLVEKTLISTPEDEKFLIQLIAKASIAQLRAIHTEFERITGVSIAQRVKLESTEIVFKGMEMIWNCIESRIGFHAERLYKSIILDGTEDNVLIRIIVTRSEIDLENIKEEYDKKYGHTLLHDILTGTVCSYKAALCCFLGKLF